MIDTDIMLIGLVFILIAYRLGYTQGTLRGYKDCMEEEDET